MKTWLIAAAALSIFTPAFALDEQAERYVRLALELGQHDPDYVDAYLGPDEWARDAEANPRPPSELARAIASLLADLQDYAPQPEESLRHRALLRNVRAMDTRIRMVLGESFSFAEEALLLYDLVLPEFDFAEFDRALADIDALIPGDGDLADRVDEFRSALNIPDAARSRVVDLAIDECRRRTLPHISLPASERFTLEYVSNQTWSGYNWYQGQDESLLQINTDFPIRIGSAVSLGCHEGYPGHHVWNVLVENGLLERNGWIEYSIFPLFGPFALIAEGSANYGIDLAFPDDDKIEFERSVLFPVAGLDPELAASLEALRESTRKLDLAQTAIAERYLDGDLSREEAIEQLRRYGLVSRQRAERSASFIDQYRSYVVNYGLGENIVRAYIERESADAEARWQVFERILTQLYTASDLVE